MNENAYTYNASVVISRQEFEEVKDDHSKLNTLVEVKAKALGNAINNDHLKAMMIAYFKAS